MGTNEGKKIKIRQTRSAIGRSEKFRRSLEALGLGRIGDEVELPENEATRGMIRRVEHVVEVVS